MREVSTPSGPHDEPDYPALYHAADADSLSGQQTFLTLSRLRLICLVGVAGVGILRPSCVGFIAGSVLLIALACEILLLAFRPSKKWYDGRALAESVKTATWRYRVGAEPFPLSEKDVDRAFIERLSQLRKDEADVEVGPAQGAQITDSMRHHRTSTLAERRNLYREYRVLDQQRWYSAKAKWNRRQAFYWQIGLVSVEVSAIIAAFLHGAGIVGVSIYGFLSAVAAAAVAWLQIKQHQSLFAAYSTASHELSSIDALLDGVSDEEQWAQFVDSAENAISREHTLWLASRPV